MNERLLPFVIETNSQLELNQKLMELIKNSNNPRLLLFYGASRQGKSTTLNQIIKGNINSWKYINKKPFEAKTCQKKITEGCNIFGPVKCSELLKRHQIDEYIKEDFDIFFCDTEGLFSLDKQSKTLIPGILTLLQVCTLSVIMINSNPDSNTIKQISSEMYFSKLLKKINKEIISPLISIYISGFQVDINNKNIDDIKGEYQYERDNASKKILSTINKLYPDLNIDLKDFNVIPGGPYDRYNEDEPDHNDIKVKLYWDSIKDIVKIFVKHSNSISNYNSDKLIKLISIVFDIFKEFTELPHFPDLSNILLNHINNLFKKYSEESFEKIKKVIKINLKNNYEKYYNILKNKNDAEKELNLIIEKDMIEIYKSFIPEKIENFYKDGINKLREVIEFQFEEEFKNKYNEIISNNYINNEIIIIKNEINYAQFKEEINMDNVKNYEKIWNNIEIKNNKLFVYFKNEKPQNIINLKNEVINLIDKIINDLISQKKIWKIFFDEKKMIITQRINNKLEYICNEIRYQEDFNILINKENLLKELINEYERKDDIHNLNNDKKIHIIDYIKSEFNNVYNKIIVTLIKKKPKWENKLKNIQKRINEVLNYYIETIFLGKTFQNEINEELGSKKILLSKIPKDLMEDDEIIDENKQNQIDKLKNEEVNKIVELFYQRTKDLLVFEKYLFDIKKQCEKIADEKIKNLMDNFQYIEDKIIFESDDFYNLLMQKLSLNIYNNNKIKDLIKKISDEKAYEYNKVLVPKKCQSWKETKESIKKKLNNKCIEFINEVMYNKSYKEDVIYNINDLDNLLKSLNIFDGIPSYKINKIKKLKNKMIENTKQIINNEKNKLPTWKDKKEIIIEKCKAKMLSVSSDDLNEHEPYNDTNEIPEILLSHINPIISELNNDKNKLNEILLPLNDDANIIAKEYISRKRKRLKEREEKIEEDKKYSEAVFRYIEKLRNERNDAEHKYYAEKAKNQNNYYY